MALSVLDGNQSATTLSSVVTGGEHIVAHSVVSLGSNAISNITTAISGSTVCVGNLGLLQSTVATEGLSASGSFIKIGGHTGTSTTGNIVHVSAVGALRVDGSVYTQPVSIASVTIGSLPAISGTVTANVQDLTNCVEPFDEGVPQSVVAVHLKDLSGVVLGTSGTPLPIYGTVTIGSALPAGTNRIGVVTIGAGTVTIGAGTAQIGSVTASNLTSALAVYSGGNSDISVNIKSVGGQSFGQGQTWVPVAIAEGSLPAGTNRIGVVTIGAGTVTIGAGTAQIGSVTVSNISSLPDAGDNPVVRTFVFGYDYDDETPIAIASDGTALSVAGTVQLGASLPAGTAQIGSVTASISNSVTIASLPAISGTVTASVSNFSSIASDIGGNAPPIGIQLGFSAGEDDYRLVDPSNPLPVTASGTVTANTFALQGTAVTTSNFTSTTASTVLAGYNATREVLTIFNEGAGNLHICAGATCTTIAYQVRLSAGDYYEVPNHQTTITHSAVFATAGTARICQVS